MHDGTRGVSVQTEHGTAGKEKIEAREVRWVGGNDGMQKWARGQLKEEEGRVMRRKRERYTRHMEV